GLELVTLGHAASRLDDVENRRAGMQEIDAGILHPPRYRVMAQATAAVLLVGREHLRPLAADPRDPVERLDIVDERRPAEDADLRDIGRPVARQAALALDRFDHRALLAADIGAGAA